MHQTTGLYDKWAGLWNRAKPSILTDYTVRPFILDLCQRYTTESVLELGCGDGYIAHELTKRGAANVVAIDRSKKMIMQAQQRNSSKQNPVNYFSRDTTNIDYLQSHSYDLVLAVFLFNSLNTSQTTQIIKHVKRILKPGGQFIFAVPHPFFPFISDSPTPLYYKNRNSGYFSGRNMPFDGEIFIREGGSVPDRFIHKTINDYMNSLRLAKFNSLPEMHELSVTQAHIDIDKSYFSPMEDQPIHLVFNIQA